MKNEYLLDWPALKPLVDEIIATKQRRSAWDHAGLRYLSGEYHNYVSEKLEKEMLRAEATLEEKINRMMENDEDE